MKRTPWHEKKVQSTFRARAIRGRRNSAEVVFMPRKKNFCTKRQMKNFPRSLLRGCADRSSFSSWESRIPSTQPRVSSWMPSPRGIHLSPGDKVCLIEWCSSPSHLFEARRRARATWTSSSGASSSSSNSPGPARCDGAGFARSSPKRFDEFLFQFSSMIL